MKHLKKESIVEPLLKKFEKQFIGHEVNLELIIKMHQWIYANCNTRYESDACILSAAVLSGHALKLKNPKPRKPKPRT